MGELYPLGFLLTQEGEEEGKFGPTSVFHFGRFALAFFWGNPLFELLNYKAGLGKNFGIARKWLVKGPS